MKSYCKGVDITDEAFCLSAVRDFLRGKKGRPEVLRLLDEHGGEEGLAAFLATSIRRREVHVEPIRYFNRIEPISGKHRVIGRESALHQCYDYVAVHGLMELFDAKIGFYQTASLPGKGQIFAQRAIRRWLREPKARYFVKLDVRKCYPSIDRDVMKALLARDVRNEQLLYLTFTLLDQFDRGINIGSFLSQYLANYYLSYAYHYAQERLRKTRLNRRTGVVTDKRLIDHCLFYMDDVLLMGHDKRDLKMAVRMLTRFFRDFLHLDLKPWKVCRVGLEPIDMVGYVMVPGRCTVRGAIFVRAMRAFRKARRTPSIPLHHAYRCVSYFGYLKNADCRQLRRKYHVDATVSACRDVIALASVERRLNERLFPSGAEAGRLAPTA